MDRHGLICFSSTLLIEMCAGVRVEKNAKLRCRRCLVETSNVVVEPYLWLVPGAGAPCRPVKLCGEMHVTTPPPISWLGETV
jgi:hypothetical protein